MAWMTVVGNLRRAETALFPKFIPALGSTQEYTNRTMGSLPSKSWLDHEAFHLLPSNARSGVEWSGVEFATDGQSASTSWCWAALWDPWPDFTCSLVWHVLSSSCRAPSATRGWVCILQCTSLTVQSRKGPIIIYYCLIWDWVPFSSPLVTRRVMVEVF
jgi:hypothetical protein